MATPNPTQELLFSGGPIYSGGGMLKAGAVLVREGRMDRREAFVWFVPYVDGPPGVAYAENS